jgi:rare lipoprotein A
MANRGGCHGVLAVLALCSTACVHRPELGTEPRSPPSAFEGTFAPAQPAPRDEVQEGYATWYGAAFAGRKTASGERFDPSQMTAAHRQLAFGTWVEVTRVDTGQSVRVRITDRGPFGNEDRIIDLSRGAAEKIDLVKKGVAKVELRIVDGP